MMTEQEYEQHAKALKTNPLLNEIFEQIDAGLVEKSRRANLANEKELMAIALGFQIKEQMVDYIQAIIDDAKVKAYNQDIGKKPNLISRIRG